MGRLTDNEFDVEPEVGNLLKGALEHGAIAGEPKRPPVVARVVGDEATQIVPVLPVEAGNVIPVALGESGLGHPDTLMSA
jgi:hypothetical protein